MVAKIKDQLLI